MAPIGIGAVLQEAIMLFYVAIFTVAGLIAGFAMGWIFKAKLQRKAAQALDAVKGAVGK